MGIYVYVDGESHFIQTDRQWRKLHGADARLEEAEQMRSIDSSAFPDGDKPHLLINRKGKFFWDKMYYLVPRSPFRARMVESAVYFTSFTGGEPELHALRVEVRNWRFDPQIVKERSMLAAQRENILSTQGVIEKAKGVDIGLTVRLLEDAYRHIFDVCYLFTSDVDYVPVIRAMQAIGRKVVVFGYKDGLGVNSDLEYVPDQFNDLSEHVRKNYSLKKPE